jgi:glycosyltransferase involved in cell wall biosynthesis
MKVLIILPAFNEESTIASVLDNLSRQYPDCDLLVINDASEDQTSGIAAGFEHIRVINLLCNLGIGGCVQTGFMLAMAEKYDVAVQFDTDGQHNVNDVGKLIRMVIKGDADIAIGSRFNPEASAGFRSSGVRKIGIMMIRLVSYLLTGQWITDHTSGFRAFSREAFSYLAVHYPTDFPEPEVIIMMGRKGFIIKEIFSQMFERQGGVSSIPLYKGPHYMGKVLLSMLMASVRKTERIK